MDLSLLHKFTGSENLPIILEIDLSRGLLTGPPSDPLTALRSRNTPQLAEVVAGLRRGARDPRVVAAVIHVSGNLPVSQAEELGTALRRFEQAGKVTVAWAGSFGELGPGTSGYYLASHARTIWIQPSGSVGLQGVALEMTTVRGLLDKISAEPQFGQRHEYKTAAEMIMSGEISAPNREMTQRLADSVTEQVKLAVQNSRRLSPEQVDQAAAASPVPASEALDRGLVDRLGFRDDVYGELRADYGRDGKVELQFAHRYARHQASRPAEKLKQRRRPIVAVVSVQGTIITGRSRPGSPVGGPSAGSDSVTAALRLVGDNDEVKAVVLRVDSPGGSYVASDAVRDAVLRLRRTGRSVIASMGRVAASGGYFVSMPCDKIVALPSTLTGSIGVLGGKIVTTKTLARLGITREAVGSGQSATMFSGSRPFDDDEWRRVEQWLDTVYDDFTHKAATDRGLNYQELESVSRGRVWTGADALQRGLVDELGDLRAAIELAARSADLDPEEIRAVPMPHLPLLARLRPAESTNSPLEAVGSAPAEAVMTTLGRAVGIDSAGVLQLPWRFELQ